MTEACEFPKKNATSQEIAQILKSSKTIAIVGLSDNPDRPSYHVAEYLKSRGYKIFPVNPAISNVLDEKAYPDLKSIPVPVDIVDIFRKPDAVPEIVREAVSVKAKTVWMQEGVVHNEAAETARNAGLSVVMNKCVAKELAKISS